MKKVYVLSKREDAELEQAIYNMDAYYLRIALYGIARGWKFDEAFSVAEEAAQQSAQSDRQRCSHESVAYFLSDEGHCLKCGATIPPRC